jgi:hypothetical protein
LQRTILGYSIKSIRNHFLCPLTNDVYAHIQSYMIAALAPPEQTGQIRLEMSKDLLIFQKHTLPSHVMWAYCSSNLEPVAYGRRNKIAVSEHTVRKLAKINFFHNPSDNICSLHSAPTFCACFLHHCYFVRAAMYLVGDQRPFLLYSGAWSIHPIYSAGHIFLASQVSPNTELTRHSV